MPQRFLRPGIRTSQRWNAVSRNAQALYIGLLTLVDDYGRYDGRPSVLHGDCFSVWNELNPTLSVSPQETASLCQQLSDQNLVIFYEVEGKKFMQLTKWQERARGKSKYPEPISVNPQESAGIRSGPLPNPASPAIAIAISHEPAPAPTPPPWRVGGGVPAGSFPETEEDAIKGAALLAIPSDFVSHTWTKAHGRGGCDSHEVSIKNFNSYLKTEWKYHKERQDKKAEKEKEKAAKKNGKVETNGDLDVYKNFSHVWKRDSEGPQRSEFPNTEIYECVLEGWQRWLQEKP